MQRPAALLPPQIQTVRDMRTNKISASALDRRPAKSRDCSLLASKLRARSHQVDAGRRRDAEALDARKNA